MSHLRLFVFFVVICAALGGATSALAGPYTLTHSGPDAAFASDRVLFPVLLAGQPPPTLISASITSGHSNAILVLQVTLVDNDFSSPGQLYGIHPTVNGVSNWPGGFPPTHGSWSFIETSQGGTGSFATTITYWLDLDQPGLMNQSLLIGVEGDSFYGLGSVGNLSFVATIVPK